MKRLLRIFVRLATLPIMLLIFIMFYCISRCFVFQEWLFENADRFYTYREYHKDFLKYSKKYILNLFR